MVIIHGFASKSVNVPLIVTGDIEVKLDATQRCERDMLCADAGVTRKFPIDSIGVDKTLAHPRLRLIAVLERTLTVETGVLMAMMRDWEVQLALSNRPLSDLQVVPAVLGQLNGVAPGNSL